MYLFKIAILSFGSIISLFILTKIMGNKEISQLNMFDYIVGITIGSIAAEMSTSLENNFLEPLIAMFIYAFVSTLISYLTCKSLKLRKFTYGDALVLLNNGKFYPNNFKKSKLDLSEFLTQCRNLGYFNITDIKTAIIEANGKISILPFSEKRPVFPYDLNIKPCEEKLPINIVLDGILIKKNLYLSGNDEIWFQKQLISQNISNIKDIFIAICDSQNNLSIFKKTS